MTFSAEEFLPRFCLHACGQSDPCGLRSPTYDPGEHDAETVIAGAVLIA